MKGGASVKATAVTAEGDRVRISVPDGSFSVARADLVGVVRMPSGAGVPEAWITLLTGSDDGRAPEPAADPSGSRPGGPGDAGSRNGVPRVEPTVAKAAIPPAWQPPYPSSDRPHLVRLANGRILRADGFWIEDGEIKLRRLGGIVGMALGEVLRLIPEELAPVHGRTAVRFSRQLGPDLLEVRVRSGLQRVRLIGVDPVTGVEHAESPWPRLALGLVVYLEFDRQRYDGAGDWLAYVFLPSGRMLNAELIRLGLARPRADARNIRYVDLFQELAEPDPAPILLPTASTK
jgi:endonuclease YncB( thermonuclease family)